MFVEAERLTPFNKRGIDVDVVLDLMIHDLDIILSLVQSKIKNIHANGVKVVSPTIDIANARIGFNNGCVANLTASRISQKSMRKMRLFQEKDYITIDFEKESIEEYKVSNVQPDSSKIMMDVGNQNHIYYYKPNVPKYDALKKELSHFVDSIRQERKPETDGESAAKALDIALKIQNIIDQ